MGTKYTSQSTSGYNASPPSDDGTAVSSNEVKWSFIKTKLADVLKTFGEGINTAILSHTDESVLDKGVTYTTTAADHKRTINVTAAATQSLGDAATMAAGYIVTIKNSHTAAITVDLATGADTLDGTAAGSLSLEPDSVATFIINSSADGYLIESQTNPNSLFFTELFAIKASDESVTSSTTLQDDNDLQLTLEASSTYYIEACFIIYSASAVPDFKATWINPDGTYNGQFLNADQHGSSLQTFSEDEGLAASSYSIGIAAGEDLMQHHKIMATTGGSGGVFKLQWAQFASDATAVTVKAGSWMKATKLA